MTITATETKGDRHMSNLKRRMIFTTIAGAFALTIATVPAGASSTPIEHFTAVETSFNGPTTVVAAGPISAVGTDVESTNHKGVFAFPDGTLTAKHQAVTRKDTFDSRTCVFTSNETGTYTIVKGSGAYVHASGSGTYNSSVVGQGCDHNQPPTVFVLTISGHGPLSLG
jgi:hypothetical protein